MVRIYTEGMFSVPKAACVKGLTSLQTSGKILKVIRELLILAKLHHIIEMLHVLDNSVQLQRKRENGYFMGSVTIYQYN